MGIKQWLRKKFWSTNKKKVKTTVFFLLLVWYYFCLPNVLFEDPTATVITSKNNELLGATIADDGQWRFPETDSIPDKFKTCLLYFEDEYFYSHPGFNPISIAKALSKNISSGKRKRGGSPSHNKLYDCIEKGNNAVILKN